MNSVSTETQSETKEFEEDIAEKYEKSLLAELEELAKNCRRQSHLNEPYAFSPAAVTQDEREDNFERLWSRARTRVDRRLRMMKQKHSSKQDDLYAYDIVSCLRLSSTSTLNPKHNGGGTLTTSDMDTLNDYSWGGIECAAATTTNSSSINGVQKKMKKKKRSNVVPNVKPRRLGE
ncbi:hypothetical protein TcWFU_007837 [Taenia crassiceps]|uniref:Uncharacterized protein n=1 Tax=Taenia crassiceps TaxID=6207 RepID=A0ABR4Q9L0_9CEST